MYTWTSCWSLSMTEPLDLCKCFCRVCKEPFGSTLKVFLNNPKDTLSRCGKLFLTATGVDVTLEKHAYGSSSYACKECFKTLELIEKRELAVAKSKALIREKAKVAEQFFSAGKRSHIPEQSPATVYTPTRSPAPKRQPMQGQYFFGVRKSVTKKSISAHCICYGHSSRIHCDMLHSSSTSGQCKEDRI